MNQTCSKATNIPEFKLFWVHRLSSAFLDHLSLSVFNVSYSTLIITARCLRPLFSLCPSNAVWVSLSAKVRTTLLLCCLIIHTLRKTSVDNASHSESIVVHYWSYRHMWVVDCCYLDTIHPYLETPFPPPTSSSAGCLILSWMPLWWGY